MQSLMSIVQFHVGSSMLKLAEITKEKRSSNKVVILTTFTHARPKLLPWLVYGCLKQLTPSVAVFKCIVHGNYSIAILVILCCESKVPHIS